MHSIPNGFRLAGFHCGLKQDSNTEDLTLIVADDPCVAAGVYTQNQIVAAPVAIDRQRTPTANVRAVVVNSGNANACTGEQGFENARRMLTLTAEAVGCHPDEVLVMSTGIIGEQLDMSKIASGIEAAAHRLGRHADSLEAAARGILTTDTRTKVAGQTVVRSAKSVHITGVAKGSGMIGPNMATLLSVILTDAALTPAVAQQQLAEAVQTSFNCISVDGHTSTNDTVLLLASGQQTPLADAELDSFRQALQTVCIDLARQIVHDGEGASHVMEIVVTGAPDEASARVIARAIANSPLVKTAIAGNDPNWGRIISAAGYAGPPLNVPKTCLTMNGVPLFKDGTPIPFDERQVTESMQRRREVRIDLSVGDGTGSTRFWTCDLTHDYVTINADYHT